MNTQDAKVKRNTTDVHFERLFTAAFGHVLQLTADCAALVRSFEASPIRGVWELLAGALQPTYGFATAQYLYKYYRDVYRIRYSPQWPAALVKQVKEAVTLACYELSPQYQRTPSQSFEADSEPLQREFKQAVAQRIESQFQLRTQPYAFKPLQDQIRHQIQKFTLSFQKKGELSSVEVRALAKALEDLVM